MNPALYCGTYAKYNNGSIAGKWMDLTEYKTAEDFFKACAELHKDEEDPEFMFQDFENFPERLYSESLSVEDVRPILEYAHLTEEKRELIGDFMEATGSGLEEYSFEQIEESVVMELEGFTPPEEQLGYHMYDNGTFELSEFVERYFDFEAYGREVAMDMHVGKKYIYDMEMMSRA